jgi:hypothetical protein
MKQKNKMEEGHAPSSVDTTIIDAPPHADVVEEVETNWRSSGKAASE